MLLYEQPDRADGVDQQHQRHDRRGQSEPQRIAERVAGYRHEYEGRPDQPGDELAVGTVRPHSEDSRQLRPRPVGRLEQAELDTEAMPQVTSTPLPVHTATVSDREGREPGVHTRQEPRVPSGLRPSHRRAAVAWEVRGRG